MNKELDFARNAWKPIARRALAALRGLAVAFCLSLNFAGIAATVAIVPLAACSTTATTTTVVSQVATDANLIAQGMSAVVMSLQAIQPPIDPATLLKLQGYVATLQKDSAAVAAATTTPATSTIQEIANVVQALAPIALSFIPGGGTLGAVVQAAVALLPAVTSVVSTAAAATPNDAVTYAAARLTLAKAAAR